MKSENQIRSELLKNLVVGLLYPAVLGNILYIILSVFSNWETYSSSNLFTLKLSLLIITTLFYFFDYLYIYFTYTFKGWMFCFDLIFIVLLFATYQNIHLAISAGDLQTSPDVLCVLLFYLSFFILYFLWDIREKATTPDIEEKVFYKWVLVWECSSALILISNIVLNIFKPNWISTTITLTLLSGITLAFGIIDFYKYRFWMKSQMIST